MKFLEAVKRAVTPNRVAVALLFISGIAAVLATILGEVSWKTPAASAAAIAAISVGINKYLQGWQAHEARIHESMISGVGWHGESNQEPADEGASQYGLGVAASSSEGELFEGNDLIAGIPVYLGPVLDTGQPVPDAETDDIHLRLRAITENQTTGHLLGDASARHTARRLAVNAAVLLLHHADETHYTEGAQRWEGIKKGLRARQGQFPRWADCSSSVTWYLWTATRAWALFDFVNGEKWLAGYTGTMVNHGQKVTNGRYLLADVALYGDPFGATGHTALLCGTDGHGNPLVISNGSEDGPFLLDLHYRPDLLEVRRYIV